MKSKTEEKTLLASVLLSSPGPIAVGIGLFFGRSSTQFADLIRRTAELGALIVSLLVYKITKKDAVNKEKFERIAQICVGAAMCVSAAIMLPLAILSFGNERGNVIPGLVIAFLGVLVNTFFWFRYKKFNKVAPNVIMAVQSRLYLAKTLVDVCVTTALLAIVIAPASSAALYMDMAGSTAVSAYLAATGIATIIDKQKK